MARTFKASGARLELDTVRGEIRIIRDKNRVTKRHQLTDCTIPFSDITAIELEVDVYKRQPLWSAPSACMPSPRWD